MVRESVMKTKYIVWSSSKDFQAAGNRDHEFFMALVHKAT